MLLLEEEDVVNVLGELGMGDGLVVEEEEDKEDETLLVLLLVEDDEGIDDEEGWFCMVGCYGQLNSDHDDDARNPHPVLINKFPNLNSTKY